MSNLTHGMNVADVEALGRFLQSRAGDLARLSTGLDRRLQTSSWCGPDADHVRSVRWPAHRSSFGQIAENLDRLGRELAEQAAAQLHASTDGGSVAPNTPGLAAPDRSAVAEGRRYLADLLTGMSSVPEGHIRITRRVDGSVVVVMPGVEDLSKSGDSGVAGAHLGALLYPLAPVSGAIAGYVVGAVSEAAATDGSSRDLRYTTPTALDPAHPDSYAKAVRAALEQAGVEPGARVLLVGHSGGAYAAASLASDETFNRNAGSGGSYDVTHVLAAGADTDQFLARVPSDTGYVVLNNQGDLASQAERLTDLIALRGDSSAASPTHHEEWFSAGSTRGAGHGIENYADFLTGGTGSPELDAFAAQVELRYGGSPMDRSRTISVPDR